MAAAPTFGSVVTTDTPTILLAVVSPNGADSGQFLYSSVPYVRRNENPLGKYATRPSGTLVKPDCAGKYPLS